MRKVLVLLALLVMAAQAVVYAIGTVKEVRLASGYDDVNRIAVPVFDGTAAQPVHFAMRSGYDRGAKIVRRGATNMFTRGPEYKLDKAIDLGTLFTEALRTESAAMGFRAAATPDAAWSVDGAVTNVYLESKQIPYGLTLFYGYMEVEMQVRDVGGAPQTRRLRFHHYYGGYNAGMGRKDEAQEAIAQLLVESAQEAVGRLNREFFKAALYSGVASSVSRLQGSTPVTPAEMHRIGLSGAAEAVQPLLDLLTREADENRRSAIIDALARLGAKSAVTALANRYATEDEDCRWYTLKAMDYIGTPEALALVKGQGLEDKDGGPRRLAGRILGSS
jgi:hypothetical protein